MNVAVGSIFRNSSNYLARYHRQYQALVQASPSDRFEPLLVEGDSTDDTWERLNQLFPNQVTKRNHGGRFYGVSGTDWHTSADSPECQRQIAYAAAGSFERVRADHDAFVWVESDLIWEPQTIMRLLARLMLVDAVAPLCIGNEPWHFKVAPLKNARGVHPFCHCDNPEATHLYDWWGFKAQGRKFEVCPPFHPMLREASVDGLYPLEVAGSCIVMKGKVARDARFEPPEHGLPAFCENLIAQGYKLWLDSNQRVRHP